MSHVGNQNSCRAGHRGPRRIRRAFTLLEIIVVVTIIAILAGIIAPRLIGRIGQAKTNVAKAECSEIAKQVQLYLIDNGKTRPDTEMELSALTSGPTPYLKSTDLLDPWGREYLLIVPGEHNTDFEVMSLGADGEQGGEGEDTDVWNE
jgi:general secretion pathway protein G